MIPRHKDGKLGPLASHAIRVSLPAQGAPEFRPFRLISMRVDAGNEARKPLDGCVRVLGYKPPPRGSEWRLPWALWAYPAKGTYCKSLHFPPSQASSCNLWECVGDFLLRDFPGTLAGAYDSLVTAVDDLKSLAIDIASQYNPFCLQAGLVAEEAQDLCESALKTGTRVALDAYLTANGIPPSLPTSADLVSAAKGDLTDLAAELLEQAGVPCDALTLTETEAGAAKLAAESAGAKVSVDADGGVDVCRDLIRSAIDGALHELRSSVSQKTAGSAGMPYYPEVVMIPEPGQSRFGWLFS